MTYNLKDAAVRDKVRHDLSRNDQFQVLFVSYPQYPDIFEFLDFGEKEDRRIRYVNLDAKPSACISYIIQE